MRLSTNELKTKYRFNIIKEEVQTSIGTLYLSKVKDYQRFFSVCGILFLERHELSSLLEKIDERLAKMYESRHIFDFLSIINRSGVSSPEFIIFLDLYRNAFKFIFHDDVIFNIKDAVEYDEMLLLIKLTHGLPVELENPNPVIARLDRIKKKMNSKNGFSVDFDSRYSTVWIASGQEPDNMTIYKFNELFHRFSAIKNHDMSVLFKTVDVSGNVEISEWFEDKFKDTTNYVDLDQMKNKTF